MHLEINKTFGRLRSLNYNRQMQGGSGKYFYLLQRACALLPLGLLFLSSMNDLVVVIFI